MGLLSHIGWTDHTLNFWTGCEKVSPGCKFCYMYRSKERWNKNPRDVIRTNYGTIQAVLRHAKPGDKIFVCSWSDFFIDKADEWRPAAWELIKAHPQFIFQILTKRIERVPEHLPADWGTGYPNVWLGVSVENQEMADKRILPLLMVPAAIHFVSYEPALGPVDFSPFTLYYHRVGGRTGPKTIRPLDWIIMGGESGNETGKYLYRACELEWFADVISQCKCNGQEVSIFVKQMGTYISKQLGLKSRPGDDINEFPASLQLQEFPKTTVYEKTDH